jgi:hypothetical protein
VATFRIATFVNDGALYDEMRGSFEAAGFAGPDTVYAIEHGDPYAAITRLGDAKEPYVVLAHQDVIADRGEGIDQLAAVLDTLTEHDPAWAIAGNAGIGFAGTIVRHVADKYGEDWRDDLPRPVRTLDENFLVLRTARRPHCSAGLQGFHLYGADACLNAARDGSSCYVVGFRVTHRGDGGMRGFEEAADRFGARWSDSGRRPHYVTTTVAHVPVARSRVVRRAMRHPRAVRLLARSRT